MPDRLKVMVQTKTGYSVPPGWGLGVRPTTSTHKNVYGEKTSKIPGRRMKNMVRLCGRGLREE